MAEHTEFDIMKIIIRFFEHFGLKKGSGNIQSGSYFLPYLNFGGNYDKTWKMYHTTLHCSISSAMKSPGIFRVAPFVYKCDIVYVFNTQLRLYCWLCHCDSSGVLINNKLVVLQSDE